MYRGRRYPRSWPFVINPRSLYAASVGPSRIADWRIFYRIKGVHTYDHAYPLSWTPLLASNPIFAHTSIFHVGVRRLNAGFDKF